MNVKRFGMIDGVPVDSVTIANGEIRAKLINFGARLTELWVPDRNGDVADIVLGFDELDAYRATDAYVGATCGRYGNRIRAGRFHLDGSDWQVDVNDGHNHLHGGKDGFDRMVWQIADLTDHSVTFTAVSEDGEMGFPGRANMTVRYSLTDSDQLVIEMGADTDRVTLMNMVHHSYFNLAGQGSSNVLDQEIRLAGDFYTPVDDELIPTSEVRAVAGTAFDFRKMKPIGANIDALPGGYDHNWCLRARPAKVATPEPIRQATKQNSRAELRFHETRKRSGGAGEALRLCAEARDPVSGRRMALETTEPGVQFYTGGFLSDAIIGKAGKRLCRYAGFALETQKFPDTPNNAHFPHCILRPGETYHHKMVFSFSADGAT